MKRINVYRKWYGIHITYTVNNFECGFQHMTTMFSILLKSLYSLLTQANIDHFTVSSLLLHTSLINFVLPVLKCCQIKIFLNSVKLFFTVYCTLNQNHLVFNLSFFLFYVKTYICICELYL